MAAIAAAVARFLSACDMGETGVAGAGCAWWSADSGVAEGNGGVAEMFCPDGANADEPHLSAGWSGDVGLREREDAVKGVAAVGVGCPAGQGQTRARRVCWQDD